MVKASQGQQSRAYKVYGYGGTRREAITEALARVGALFGEDFETVVETALETWPVAVEHSQEVYWGCFVCCEVSQPS